VHMGADVNIGDKQKTTPLHLAAQRGHVYACRTLLTLGADGAVTDAGGYSALYVAVHSGNGAVFAELLSKQGTDEALPVHPLDGSTVLHTAASQGGPTGLDLIKTLLAAEKQARKRAKADSSLLFDVDARVKKAEQFHMGDTALMMAARNGEHRMCATLMAAGADASLTTADGQTIYEIGGDGFRKNLDEWLSKGKAKGRRATKKPKAARPSTAAAEAASLVESEPAGGGGGGLAAALAAAGLSAHGVAALSEKSLLTTAALADLVGESATAIKGTTGLKLGDRKKLAAFIAKTSGKAELLGGKL
jgi:hypothetical protein